MAIKERQAKLNASQKKRLAEERNTLIEMNQSLKGITWSESKIPTLTNLADNKSITKEKAELIFDLIEDFIPRANTANGHQPNCSCIKCQPKQHHRSVSPLASISIETNIQPLNKKY